MFSSTYLNLLPMLLWASLCTTLGHAADTDRGIATGYPNLTWQPRPFKFTAGPDPRYIDFAQGNDANPGTREAPWKHHPWDKNATANAAASCGIHTYVFKRGVVYYGALQAKESGQPGNPIRLTSDPAWGRGRAVLCGSVPVRGGWKPCAAEDAPTIPAASRARTWYRDLDGKFTPRLLFMVREGQVTRVPIARTPNWQPANPNDPRSQWWELTGCILELELTVDTVAGFKTGDEITGTGKWEDFEDDKSNVDQGHNRIIAIGRNTLRIKSWQWRYGEIKKGATVIGRKGGRAKVTGMWGTHRVIRHLVDTRHLTATDPRAYQGAVIRVEGNYGVLPRFERVFQYDPQEHSLAVILHRGAGGGPERYSRYQLEGLPAFLDQPGEWCYVEAGKDAGRIYLRLPGDRDPNQVNIEVAEHPIILAIHDRSNVEISGLSFRGNNSTPLHDPTHAKHELRHATIYMGMINCRGNCSNITVRNCDFSHGTVGIAAHPAYRDKPCLLDRINITDCDFSWIDGSGIALGNGRSHYYMRRFGSKLVHVRIMRNRVRHTGYRTLGHFGLGSGGDAILVEGGELVEVAGNEVRDAWGCGIWVFNANDYRNKGITPLIRVLVHHNKVVHTLLAKQDYGGIASWLGGPAYVYNNISGDAVGYKHVHHKRLKMKDWYRTSCFGCGIYFDGQYKGYAFNNIIWGTNNNVNDEFYSSTGFNEAMGFLNTVFNNTIYNFGVGSHKDMTQHNRCQYLGNLMLDIGLQFFQHELKPEYLEYDGLAFADNVFYGHPTRFGFIGWEAWKDINRTSTLPRWQAYLRQHQVIAGDTGIITPVSPVRNAEAHDFRLVAASAAIDRGVKVFVPWGLYAVVGEWHFIRHPADPALVPGANINMDEEWFHRAMFQEIPRNNLHVRGLAAGSFTRGTLEDWVDGALQFDGRSRYCVLTHKELTRSYKWGPTRRGHSGSFDGTRRRTVDMGTNNFLIEVVFKTTDSRTGGTLVCKCRGNGYSLRLDQQGRPVMALVSGSNRLARTGGKAVNDNQWHHLIAEVDRAQGMINIYLDGRISNGATEGSMPATASLANPGDFLVGRSAAGDFLAGAMDFLRISRGTLTDAETTISELYQWEFDGPFLKDFLGHEPRGAGRDAGAMEY